MKLKLHLWSRIATFAILLALAVPGQGQSINADAEPAPSLDTSRVLVQLEGEPLSTHSQTRPPQGKKIDFNSSAVKSYRAQLSALRNDFKKWLQSNAPKARVTSEFDLALNGIGVQLNGVDKATIERAPRVVAVEYQGIPYLLAQDPGLSLVHAFEAWSANGAGGAPNAGAGVKVAIIDSAIDSTHPCFSDFGYPPVAQLGDRRFTNNKVIVSKVFNNTAGDRRFGGGPVPPHGTSVAGIVGCNESMTVTIDGVAIPFPVSGVAPRALLGSYNIVGGFDEDVVRALEAAYTDGFDIANMSLGFGQSGIKGLLRMAVDALDQANMVVAVGAGNDGPGYYTVASAGSAARALTAGASTLGQNPQASIAVGGVKYPAARGSFGTALISAPLAVVHDPASPYGGLSTACSALPADSLAGQIALISRGDCAFSVKIRNAQNAGAVGAVVVNNIPGIFAMSQDGSPSQPTIPAYMVDLSAREILTANDGATTTFLALEYHFDASKNDIMTSFSSQGPTDVDFRVKPDVVAPGLNVITSMPLASCGGAPCWTFFGGTSAAAPYLAGSAAVVRAQHPTWSAAQIRSAIVNTADQGVLKNYLNPAFLEEDVNIIGAGRLNLLSAVNAQVALDPVSTSFGSTPSGAGQTRTSTVTLTNLGTTSKALAVSIGPGADGVSYTVSPSSVTLAAGASETLTVTMAAAKDAARRGHQSTLTIRSGTAEVAHAVVYTLVK